MYASKGEQYELIHFDLLINPRQIDSPDVNRCRLCTILAHLPTELEISSMSGAGRWPH